ncbi:AAA family ATPase [Janthinobacterium sp. MDT1-19]|uniref:AAA family ATPase n=1 Tax=Janthinobacterium sp. MDT1-19 TaxID=1259339 RepID=UPI003F296286
MIKAIKKLKNFGIFKDYKNNLTQDFGKYNLIYGWNGTGKSTLSNLFSSLEKKSPHLKFSESEFLIETNDGNFIDEKTISNHSLNIQVFNQKFIQDNIDWDNSVKSILLVAKEKIEDIKKLDALKVELKQKEDKANSDKKVLEKLESDQSKFMTDSARHIKTGLQSIDTSDTYYLNYDKRKLDSFIQKNKEKIEEKSSILDKHKIIEHTNAAKSDKLAAIRFSKTDIDEEYYKKAATRLQDLLKTTAVSKTIKRLTENGDIQAWVQSGLNIHKSHESDNCEFCGSTVSEVRLNDIENHFSEEFKIFKTRLESASEWLSNQLIPQVGFPEPANLYKEFIEIYKIALAENEIATEKINKQIKQWQNSLNLKLDNSFRSDITINEIESDSISSLNSTLKNIEEILNKHDKKTDNFSIETKRSKEALELHYAANEIVSFEYKKKEKTIVDERDSSKKILGKINELSSSIKLLEQSLSNESIGAEKFNESLHKFIGRSELCLKFNTQRKGYEIIRNNDGAHDGNLSEGEKTAIAFIYFITKLEENNNKISETIVVVDDPVSSFDSNHLFHSYSFLKNKCLNAKQLFVLTHNFTYYKLVRDWFYGTNKNRLRSTPKKDPISFFYKIDTSPILPRTSALTNADKSLTEYNSEYHYIFERLYFYKEKATLDRDEAFLTANLARKLVESFFTFKFPKGRSDISTLMESGLKNCITTTPETKEKIYRFINKYSHSDVIEVNEEAAENLAGESHSVIGDIFKWIEEVDKVHYSEMVEVASTQ